MVSRPTGVRVQISTPRFTLEGKSRAGNETWFRVRELNLALDIGRCPDVLVGVPHVLVTHAHLDHALGIPYYAAQRTLQRLPAGKVYVPAENLDDYRALMALHEKLEGTTYDLDLVGLALGEEAALRKDLVVRTHRSTHRVPTNAYEIVELRHKLRPEHAGRPATELAALRAAGIDPSAASESSLLFYTGDTDRGILETNQQLYNSEVLVIECSFVDPGDRDRGPMYRHLHIDDLFDFQERFENDVIVLTHFSLRYSVEEIHHQISRRCPTRLTDRIRLALPEPFVKL